MKNNHMYNKIFEALRNPLLIDKAAAPTNTLSTISTPSTFSTPKKRIDSQKERTQPSTDAKTSRTVKFRLARNTFEFTRKPPKLVSAGTNTENVSEPPNSMRRSASNMSRNISRIDCSEQNVHRMIQRISDEVNSHFPSPKAPKNKRALSTPVLSIRKSRLAQTNKTPSDFKSTQTGQSTGQSSQKREFRKTAIPASFSQKLYGRAEYCSLVPARDELAISILQYQLDRKLTFA